MQFINSDNCVPTKELYEETKKDSILKQALELSEDWHNNKNNVSLEVRHNWNVRSEIPIDAGIVYFDDRIVIPNS